MKVLIVDDNEELGGFLALCLTESAVDAVVTADAGQALEKAQSGDYDVLVIDSVMNGVDGIELVQKIRATSKGKKVPILVMSSISTALARRMATSAGGNEFLVKPFGQFQFIEQVKNLAR